MGFKEGHNSAEAEPQCFGSTKLYTSVNLTGESLTVRIAPDKEFVAVGECNGIIQFFPLPHMTSKLRPFELRDEREKLPCTDMEFVPRQSDKRRVLAAYASGFVRLWQYGPGGVKITLSKVWQEPEYRVNPSENKEMKLNQILCIGASHDGKRFVTGGSDTVIRVYEINSSTAGKMLIPSIRTDSSMIYNFHTNRITAILYHPRGAKDPAFGHTFVSASWDGTIQGWDDRTCGSLWQHVGTTVSGADGLCIDPLRNLVISGCYKHDKVLAQVWEARPAVATDTKKPLSDMGKPLSQVAQEVGSPPTQVYVARIATDQQFMIFAGTNANLVKFVNSTTLRTVGLVSNLSNGVYSADCCADPEDRKRFIVAFTNRLKVYLLLVDPRQPTLAEAPVPV